jgi:hypothetical protein
MSKREAYKQKIQGEMDLVLAKILEFRGAATIAVADARIQATSTIEDLEKRFDKTKAKLSEMNDAGDDAWESVKDGVEKAWGELRKAFGEAKERFQK